MKQITKFLPIRHGYSHFYLENKESYGRIYETKIWQKIILEGESHVQRIGEKKQAAFHRGMCGSIKERNPRCFIGTGG